VIFLKSKDEIEIMRRAGAIAAEVLLKLESHVRPGVTTEDLDRIAEEHIRGHGAIPTFVGYQGYPKTLCTSINEEVVHGIPSAKRILKEGDIIGIDCGVTFQGFVGDHAKTFCVGSVSEEKINLVMSTAQALEEGIRQVAANHRVGDVSSTIQSVADRCGYGIVKDFVGHGIGRKMHEEPQVPNFGTAGTGPRLKAGMVLAIEPMFNLGTGEVKVLGDGWTVVTKDRKASAHFEHTVALTEEGPVVLTRP
jgi:methionyl aminopeptidase